MGSLILPALLAGAAPASASGWTWSPRLSVGGGSEDDLILGSDSTAILVAGGGFLEIVPSLAADRRLGRRAHLRLEGRAHLERFLNDADRLLGAGALQGDLFVATGGGLGLRLSGGGGWFADSERPEVERLDGSVELAGGGGGRRWRLEALGGFSGRRYPELAGLDDGALGATYGESALEAGGALFLRPSGATALQLRLARQRTAADDPLFDARAWSWRTSARLALAPSAALLLHAAGQERTFSARAEAEDSDSYYQLGAGVERALGAHATLVGRYAYSRYEGTAGDAIDSHRMSLAIGVGFGGAAARPRAPAIALLEVEAAPARAGAPHLFRFRAPGAVQVAVVGDFNGWDAAAGALAPVADGWWERALPLPAGSHEYAYVVDGRAVAPPEAGRTVPDGFGGRNGVIEVLAAAAAR